MSGSHYWVWRTGRMVQIELKTETELRCQWERKHTGLFGDTYIAEHSFLIL